MNFIRLSALRDLVFKRAAAETALIRLRGALARHDLGGTHSTYLPAFIRRTLARYDERVKVTPAKAEQLIDKIFGEEQKHVDTFFIHGAPTKVAYTARPFPSMYLSQEIVRDACWPLTPPKHTHYSLDILATIYLRKPRSLAQQVIDASHRTYMHDLSGPNNETYADYLQRRNTEARWQQMLNKMREVMRRFHASVPAIKNGSLQTEAQLGVSWKSKGADGDRHKFASGGVIPQGDCRVWR